MSTRAALPLPPDQTIEVSLADIESSEPRDARAFDPRQTLELEPRETRALSPVTPSHKARQRLPVVPAFVAQPVDELAQALAASDAERAQSIPGRERSTALLAPCDQCTRVIPHRPTLPTPSTPVVRHFQCDGRCVKPRAPYQHACPPPRTNPLFATVLFVLLAVASCVVTLASGAARADGAVRAQSAVERVPVRDVLAAAYRTAGLDANLGRSFATRARLAALVPWLSVRTARDTNWRDGEPDVSRGTTVEVRATWRLDRLVFEGRELQVVSLEAARRRERRKLGQQVVRVYFVWRRAVRAQDFGAGEPEELAGRAEEAAAELDDLTGGWFTEQLEGPPAR